MRERTALTFQGYNVKVAMTSNGILGSTAFAALTREVDSVGLEYPVGSKIEHLYHADFWFGALARINSRTFYSVTSTQSLGGDCNTLSKDNVSETFIDTSKNDGAWRTSIFNTGEPNRRFFDDDGDGLIDEDPLDGLDNDGDWLQIRDDLNHNGRPDHGEPNVDEDYGAISESDVIFVYRDSFPEPHVPGHTPLNLKIIQKSYAWSKLVKEPIILIEYSIINDGFYTFENCYLGVHIGTAIGIANDAISRQGTNYFGYFTDLRLAYFDRDEPGIQYTPFGVALLDAQPVRNPHITHFPYHYYYFPSNLSLDDSLLCDETKYGWMLKDTTFPEVTWSAGTFKYLPTILSIGPIERLSRGDTAKFVVAFIGGEGISAGRSNLRDNAIKAIELYRNNYIPASVPPSPPLRLTPLGQAVKLDFKWRAGDPKFDPLETWDDSNAYVNTLPDTHWRRRNPPPGKQRGGRVFEGFKLWRSDFPAFEEKSFSLLYQFDVADDLNIGAQTGLQFTYIDSNIVRGKRYWYAVTSYSIPDYLINSYPGPNGETIIDTLFTDPVESFLHENVFQVPIPFAPSTQLGKVKVVPNPYRTDRDYTYEGGGWEGLGRSWNEEKRLIWFIHLPPICTIRIFTIAGEVVKTLHHDDALREANGLAVGQEEFYLLSESNRALASGIYVYLVESEYGTQTGKFVVIR